MVLDIFDKGLKKSFVWVRRRPIVFLLTMLVPAAILLVPALYAEVGLAKLVQSDWDDMLMITYEIVNEKGGDFIAAKQDHAEMLAGYIGHIEARHMKRSYLDFILRWLYPELSPKQQLQPILFNLKKPTDDPNEARKSIEAAGEALKGFCISLEGSSRIDVSAAKYESFSEEFLAAANNALDESNRVVDIYSKNKNVENAQIACRKNRKAIVFVYPVVFRCLGSISEEKLRRFGTDIQRTISYNDALYKKVKDGKLLEYTGSEQFRLKILQKIFDHDFAGARELLVTAIHKAHDSEKT